MAQTSILWTTGGAGDGASAYTQAQVLDWQRRMFVNDPTAQGVIPDYPKTGSKELAATVGGTTVTIAPGAAVVYGIPYESTASEPIVVPTPTIGTTGHRIVLRADWTARTVRLALVSSSNGVSALPTLTQSAGSTWELPLYTLTITTGGVITLADVRGFLHANTRVSSGMLDAGAANDAAIGTRTPDQTVAATSGAGTLTQILNWLANRIKAITGATNWYDAPAATLASLSSGKLDASGGTVSGALAVTGALTANGGLAVTGALTNAGSQVWHAGNDGQGSGLDADLLAGVAIEPIQRRGGSATDWSVAGGTAYSPTSVRIQVGRGTATLGSSQTSALTQINFPTNFANAPVVVVTPAALPGGVTMNVNAQDSSTFFVSLDRVATGAALSITFSWIAIGPA